MGSATLTVIHHDADSEPLRQSVHKLVEAGKSSSDSPRFLVYKPVEGSLPDGADKQLSFVWIDHGSGDPNAPVLADALGEDAATDLISEARAGVNSVASKQLNRTRSGGKASGPAKYVLALAFRHDPSKLDDLKEAADAFDEAYRDLGADFRYAVHETGNDGERLILIGTDSPQSFKPRFRETHGDRADELISKLEGAVQGAWALPLRYVPAVSNP